jgi:DNA repair exonuclease SbcCD nuclease subunit
VRLQILSDLHLETEPVEPVPAPGAELLVLAGDIDATWRGFERFAGWPVPVLLVAGNHEYDGRDVAADAPALRAHVERLGIRLLERESAVVVAADGRRVRFVGCTRWTDFDGVGVARREKALRAGDYFQRVMRATLDGAPFDALAVRALALASRDWLEHELARPGLGLWDRTVAVTHFAPSARSHDPRYGLQASTASFVNADDDLLDRADLWIHGHVHCRQDWRQGRCRVVSNARGHASRGEADGWDGAFAVEV